MFQKENEESSGQQKGVLLKENDGVVRARWRAKVCVLELLIVFGLFGIVLCVQIIVHCVFIVTVRDKIRLFV
jgi:hypothetical protein